MSGTRFCIVLHSVPRTRAAGARFELARLFEIDDDIASDICGAAPIVVLEDLEPEVAIEVKQALQPLADKGAQLHLTDAPCDEIPKVNWPELPEIVRGARKRLEARSTGSTVRVSAVPVRELARLRCPACSEALSVVPTRDLDRLQQVQGPVAEAEPAPHVTGASPQPPAPEPPPAAPARREEEQETPQPEAAAAAPRPEASRHPDLEQGPLVRALQEKRLARESQRLAPVSGGNGGGAPHARQADAEEVAPAPSRPRSEQAATERDEEPADRPRSPEAAEPSSALDIDEALRLLDNVIEQPAPAGVAPAPPPEPELPELESLLEETELGELSDFEIDVELGEIEGREASAPRQPAPRAGASRRTGSASSPKLAPLEPEEALRILESARSPESSDEMIFERPLKGPVSDELEPLDPEQALALLAQTTAAEKRKRNESGAHRPRQGSAQARPAAAGRDEGKAGRAGAAGSGRSETQRSKSGRRRIVEPEDDAPVHGLVLSRIANEAKRQRAAEIIAELTGMSREEAQALANRPVIPVLKGVPRQQAEQALERFRTARISGRVTTRRLR